MRAVTAGQSAAGRDDKCQHIVPRDDLITHEIDETCVCQPTPYWVWLGEPVGGVLYVHHSLDGREAHEPKEQR